MLQAGVAQTNLTPFWGVELTGWGYYLKRTWREIADPIHATAFAFEQEGVAAIIVALDLMVANESFVAATRKRIREAIGIPEAAVMICCTHTHSAPACGGLLGVGETDSTYQGYAEAQAATAAILAWRQRRPAQTAHAATTVPGLQFNRTRSDGVYDDHLTVLRVDGVDGRPIGAVVNFAGHPTVETELQPFAVSGDLPGRICRSVEAAEPGRVTAYLQGACGDVNFLREFQTPSRRLEPAQRLTRETLDLLHQCRPDNISCVRVTESEVALPTRRWTREEIAADRDEAAQRLERRDTAGWRETIGRSMTNRPDDMVKRHGGDAVVVENTTPAWAPGEEWTVAPSPHRVIGVFEGDENYQFSRVVAASVRSDGSVVAADEGTRTIRLFDSAGAFSKTLGGPGGGPGEFTRPTQILIGDADSVFVWDDAAYRLTKFDAHGVLAGVQTFDRAEIQQYLQQPFYPGQATALATGGLVVRLVAKAAGKEGPESGRTREESGVLRVSNDLSSVERLMRMAGPELVTVDAAWGPWAMQPPLARRGYAAVHPKRDVACFGDAETSQVRCFTEDGSSKVLQWSAPAIPVLPEDAEIAAFREQAAVEYRQKLSAEDIERLLDQLPRPKEYPAFSQLLLDPDGNLWVRRGPVSRGEERAVEFLVFESTGRLLGTVLFPPVTVMEVGRNYVLGVYKDEMDVDYLWMLSLDRGPGTRAGRTRFP